jgi:hypothetical protein
MSDIHDVIQILEALRKLVGDEPALSAFIPAADAVLNQANALAKGDRDIPMFDAAGSVPMGRNVPTIPTRDLAIALRKTFDDLPTIETGGDERLTRAYARLLRNAHVSILHAVFKQYPDILPKPSADS